MLLSCRDKAGKCVRPLHENYPKNVRQHFFLHSHDSLFQWLACHLCLSHLIGCQSSLSISRVLICYSLHLALFVAKGPLIFQVNVLLQGWCGQ